MNKMNHILQAITVFASLLLTSCEHKDLCYNHFHTTKTQVVFDWKDAPDATPETMRLYLFPMDGGKPQVYEFTDYRGGSVNVPAGCYKVLCVNSDTESVLYRNIDLFDGFEAYTPDAVLNVRASLLPRPENTSGERIAKSPDYLASACLDNVTIEASQKDQMVILYPKPSVCRYRVTITNVSNLKYISSDGIFGVLSGMSEGVLVGCNKPTFTPVTVPFGVISDGISTLTADFWSFGQTASEDYVHKLVIYVIMSDGSKNYYTFDVTRQIDQAADPHDIHILLDGLPLPKPIVNGGGFQPTVDEWQNIEVDVPM